MDNFPFPLCDICQAPRGTLLFWTGLPQMSLLHSCLLAEMPGLGQAFRGPGLRILGLLLSLSLRHAFAGSASFTVESLLGRCWAYWAKAL